MALFRAIFSAIHPTMTFIILIINICLFLGVLSLVDFVKKNHKKWIKSVEQKVDDKVDEFKKDIPGIMRESMSFGSAY